MSPGENGALFSGSKLETGPIDYCQVCRNKSELGAIPNDDRMMCEECAKVIIEGRHKARLVQNVPTPGGVQFVPAPPVNHVLSEEKELYLYQIRSGITDAMIDELVDELVKKRVFHYDFDRIIENDRWFSLMDLRRLAMKVNPAVDKAEIKVEPDPKPKVKSKPNKGVKNA